MGWRKGGGFVGVHDRVNSKPVPDHISARPKDVPQLISGLINTNKSLVDSDYDPVLAAALIAFGFVFIHPFADGNGRVHRYLIHHVLAKKGFAPKGLIFPVSAVIFDRIDEYKQALEVFSKSRLDFIEWKATPNGNVEVLNDTIDLYRYFDATKQAEFLYECVEETVTHTLPEEVEYLERHDKMRSFIAGYFDMPDKDMENLIGFLRQNDGRLSKRARTKKFKALTDDEVAMKKNFNLYLVVNNPFFQEIYLLTLTFPSNNTFEPSGNPRNLGLSTCLRIITGANLFNPDRYIPYIQVNYNAKTDFNRIIHVY